MSTSNPDPKTDIPSQERIKGRSELKVVQHSMLFYWWPVWAVGFLLFVGVLLLVIVITNVPLRGLWSVVVIVLLVLGVVIISLIQDAWASIFHWFGLLDIHINAAGFLAVALVLFAIWAITVFWFDQQI